MITTLVFDVNETMLDLSALDPHFDRIFTDRRSRAEWFALVLRNALTLTVTKRYSDFGAIAGASLTMVAATRGITLTQSDRDTIAAAVRNLPPHADVAPSLDLVQRSGLKLAALTNSPPDIATAQLANAGLARYFTQILSVHPTQRFKPHPATYRHAAEQLATPLEQMMMVAAHDWDIAGAMAVGMQGAYITRPGMALNPLLPPPTITAPTMDAITELITQL